MIPVGVIQTIYSLTNFFALCVFCVDVIPCVAVTPTQANCTSQWILYGSSFARDSVRHYGTTTLEQCQKACEFDPRCVAVDVDYREGADCLLNINPSHTHKLWFSYPIISHYELVSRCNITPGQCVRFWESTVLLWYDRVGLRWTPQCTYPDLVLPR